MESQIEVAVQLDKERHFRLDMGAMEIFQEERGRTIASLFKEMEKEGSEDIPPKDLNMLLYACLKHEDESLTLDDIRRLPPYLIYTDGVTNAIVKAMTNAFGVDEGSDPLAPNRATRRAAKKKK